MSDELMTDNPASEPTSVDNFDQEPVEQNDAPEEDKAEFSPMRS